MTDDYPDPSEVASRVRREAEARNETPIPADAEAAWTQWIAGVRNVDERTKALLRAAFEVGVEAARQR